MIVGPDWDTEQIIQIQQDTTARIGALVRSPVVSGVNIIYDLYDVQEQMLYGQMYIVFENMDRLQLVEFLGRGNWSEVYLGADGMAYVFTNETPDQHSDFSKLFWAEVNERWSDLAHIPLVTRLGRFSSSDGQTFGLYQMPRYHNLTDPQAMEQFYALKICVDKASLYGMGIVEVGDVYLGDTTIMDNSQAGKTFDFLLRCVKGEIDIKHVRYPDRTEAIRKVELNVSVLPESILEELVMLCREAERFRKMYGIEFAFDISLPNVAQDDEGNLILLDLLHEEV